MNSVLQATYQFQPYITLEYDQEKKLFVGRMLMRGLTYDFEGPDAENVTRQIEDTLLEEYRAFERSISQDKGRGAGEGANNRDVEYRVRGRVLVPEMSNIQEHEIPIGPSVKGAWKGLEYAGALHSLLTGNYLDLIASLLLGFSLKKGHFTALVGGRRIRATSRHKLRKEVERMRNRLIHEIVEAIRLHNKSRQIAEKVSSRITMKREHAKANWEGRVMGSRPRGEDWRGRVLSLRHGIEEKRMGAQEQWVGL